MNKIFKLFIITIIITHIQHFSIEATHKATTIYLTHNKLIIYINYILTKINQKS